MSKKQIRDVKRISNDIYCKKAIDILNNYITYRKKYLIQNKSGYSTIKRQIYDYNLKQHITNKQTCGIFVNKVSKFLTFDIDIREMSYEKWILRKVIYALEEEGLGEYLNISISGKKGYHIDLLFNIPIKVGILKELGEYILEKYDLKNIIDYEKNEKIAEVELRGCNMQGVKLPLGVNKQTNKKMYYLNDEFEPIKIKKFISEFKIKIIETKKIYELYDSVINDNFYEDKIFQFKEDTEKIRKKIKKTSEADYDKLELNYVAENNQLKNSGSRNKMIYLIALWCNTQRINKEEALNKLKEIMDNTPDELFNDKTSSEWKYFECIKVINKVYEKNYVLFDIKKIMINKKILKFAMKKCKTLKQMNILLCHIYYYLKWSNGDGVYYLSQKTIKKYTGATNKTVKKLNEQLKEIGVLEEVEKGGCEFSENNVIRKIASKYRLNIKEKILTDRNIEIKEKDINIIKLLKKHFDKKKILKYLSRQTYNNNFEKKCEL